MTDSSLPIANGPATVLDFWRWGYSSLAENATRGVFAEYLVGLALGVTDEPRLEWDAADLRYRDQLIEVKSSADNQVWAQEKPSIIVFDIGRKRWWNAQTNTSSPIAERPAKVYVFCHYFGPAESEEVVDQAHWDFYVVPTSLIDRERPDGKTARVSTIRKWAAPVPFTEIRAAVDAALAA